jgi:signal transduction histidine kinase
MEQARDTGKITMSPGVGLAPQDPADKSFGFIIFVPLYKRSAPVGTVTQRREALDGFVFASFRSDSFFRHVVGDSDSQNINFVVHAGSGDAKSIIYESPTYKDIASKPYATKVSRKIELYGQTWIIDFATDSRTLVSSEQLSRPEGLLFFGTLSSFLVAAVVLLLIKARARDLSTQKEKAVQLAKDELLSLASHQLRTPATGVKQYVGMVLQGFAGKVPSTQKKLLEKAYASNDRQLRIINEILHLAKIESGRIVLAKQLTNLNELVSDVVNEQTPDIEAAKHKIKVNLPKEPLVIHADTHMLRMAIENLLSNAIKYTPGGGHITVHVHKENSNACISVTDNGVGIESGDADKVFRQFSRLSNVMSQQVGGTGIGLYLAKHLVELHNGRITMESQPGKGSTFTIIMPLHESLSQHMRNLTVRPKS